MFLELQHPLAVKTIIINVYGLNVSGAAVCKIRFIQDKHRNKYFSIIILNWLKTRYMHPSVKGHWARWPSFLPKFHFVAETVILAPRLVTRSPNEPLGNWHWSGWVWYLPIRPLELWLPVATSWLQKPAMHSSNRLHWNGRADMITFMFLSAQEKRNKHLHTFFHKINDHWCEIIPLLNVSGNASPQFSGLILNQEINVQK